MVSCCRNLRNGLFFIFLAVSTFAWSQNIQKDDDSEFENDLSDEYNIIDQYVINEEPDNTSLQQLQQDGTNEVILMIDGSHNEVSTMQTDESNFILINQVGDYNNVNIQEIGTGNAVQVNQTGGDLYEQGNEYEGLIIGNENTSLVDQVNIGTEGRNTIQQTLEGDGFNYEILQYGSDLHLIHSEDGTGAPAYKIEQRGPAGMTVEIEYVQFPSN